MGILDTIMHTKQHDSLKAFKPSELVSDIISALKDRDKQILTQRYGLDGSELRTLAAIGTEHKLTRERVRQIEKDLLKQLKKVGLERDEFLATKELLIATVHEHGKVIAQDRLLKAIGVTEEQDRNAIIFLLHLVEELESYMHASYKTVWASVLFNRKLLHEFGSETEEIFRPLQKPADEATFLEHFKKTPFFENNKEWLTDAVIKNFLDLAHQVEQNAFGHWGLKKWKEIVPKDVGDKAYLVMKHHGKPEHYSVITDMINSAKFGHRTAYKETVHNELIKDPRFVLIGRGIYALGEWGYKAGVVGDVISDVIKAAGKPLTREQIIDGVLSRRVVKKNTVLVGLSSKERFKKVGKNLYDLV